MQGIGFRHPLARFLAVALAYFITGRLGLELAIPPGYATAIWPPSGIALASLLLLGPRMWPAVAIGSFLVNVSNGFDAHDSAALLRSLAIPAAIAGGAALQAVTGAALVRRFGQFPNALADAGHIVRLMLLGGPIACLINATVGLSTLYASGLVPAASISFSWLTWWVGDSIGVTVFTPVVIAWLMRRHPHWRQRWLPITICLSAAFSLTVLLVHYTAATERARLQHEFNDRAHELSSHVGESLNARQEVISLAKGLQDSVGTASRKTFTLFAARLRTTVRGITVLEWAPRVSAQERIRFETQNSANIGGQYEIKERQHGQMLRAGERPEYFPVTFLEPLAENETARGFDLASAPDRQQALERARDSGKLATTSMISLVQSGGDKRAVLALAPVYRQPQPPATVAERRRQLVGFVVGVFRLVSVEEEALKGQQTDVIHYWLIDKTDPSHTTLLATNATRSPSAFQLSERGLFGGQLSLGNQTSFTFGGRNWTLQTAPNQAFLEHYRQQNSWFILFGGLLCTTLVGAFVLVVTGREGTLQELVDTQTKALTDSVRRSIKLTEELQQLIDHMPPMFAYWDIGLCNRYSNRAYAEWFGFTTTSIHGKPLQDAIPRERYDRILPHVQAVQQGEPQIFEHVLMDRDSNPHQTVVSYLPDIRAGTVEGFYVFISDITSLKDAQRAREKAEAHLQSIIDAATEFSIISTDLDGTIQLFSRGAEYMLGYRSDEMVGRQTPAIIHLAEEIDARGKELSEQFGQPVEGFEVFVHLPRSGVVEGREWTYRRSDGSLVPVNLVVSDVRNANGELIGFLGIATDITRQKAYHAAMQAAKDAAEAASRAKSDFVANMSHEIRTPLNAVLGMTHLLENTALRAEQRKYTHMIRAAGESLLMLLNDILDFSKIEADKLELENTVFSLEKILDATGTIMAVNATDKDLELAIGIDPAIPKQLVGDSLRVQQVLTNLASNAIKFTEQGSVTVYVQLETSTTSGVVLRFEVRDTGIGIEEGQRAKLFNAFTQADTSTTRRYGGTGLGLTISRQLVERMGGQIGFDSAPGVGSCFWFSIPLNQPEQPEPPSPPPVPGPFSVLVADDNPANLGFLCEHIKSLGWQADGVPSGNLALQRYREKTQQGQRYDVVILDWQMPHQDSIGVMRELKQQDPAIPVIIMTHIGISRQLDQLPEHALIGAALVKPVTSSSLLDAIQQAITSTASAAKDKAPGPSIGTKALLGARILLVEDNQYNQIVARGILEQAGATVGLATHGQEALAILREHPQDFDIVLMDVQMPVMDGFEATRLIRSELKLELPILAMTAGVMASDRNQCLQAGMDDFIAKPIDVDQMLRTITRYFSPAPSTPSQPAEVINEQNDVPFDIEEVVAAFPPGESYRAVIRGMVETFCKEGMAPIEAAINAWQSGQHQEAMQILHKTRGGLGSLGAKRVAAVALNIELAMKEEQEPEAERQWTVLRQEMETALNAAQTWLLQQQHARKNPASTSQSIPPEALSNLRSALAEQNMSACSLYLSLRPALQPLLPETDLNELDQAMNDLQFDRALAIIAPVAMQSGTSEKSPV